jgi:DNA gyrase subunit B
MHTEEGVSAAEVIMTQLHAGGKFDQNSYKVSGGLHGVGVSVVNALSSWLELRIWRGGKEHMDALRAWRADGAAGGVGEQGGRKGTEVTFLPSPKPSRNTDFASTRWSTGCANWPSSIPACSSPLADERGVERRLVDLHYEGGVEGLRPLSRPLQAAADRRRRSSIDGEKDGITVEVALWWNDSYHENVLCFTNNIPQRDGGTHLAGFRGALTRIRSTTTPTIRHREEGKGLLSGDDCREGLTCVLSVKVPDPKFSSQTKDKLVSSEVRPVVESAVNEGWPPGSRNTRPKPRTS